MVRIHSASFAYNYEQNLEFSDKLLQSLKLFKLYTCTIKLIENEWNIWKIFVDIIKKIWTFTSIYYNWKLYFKRTFNNAQGQNEKKTTNKIEGCNERLRHDIFVNLFNFSKCEMVVDEQVDSQVAL